MSDYPLPGGCPARVSPEFVEGLRKSRGLINLMPSPVPPSLPVFQSPCLAVTQSPSPLFPCPSIPLSGSHPVPPSPCPPIPLSRSHPVSPSPRLPVSQSPSSHRSFIHASIYCEHYPSDIGSSRREQKYGRPANFVRGAHSAKWTGCRNFLNFFLNCGFI